MLKTTLGCVLAVVLLFTGSAYAADPAQQAPVADGVSQFTFEAGPIVMNRVQGNRAIWSSPGNPGSGDVLKSSRIDDDWRVGGQARMTFDFQKLYIDFGGFWIPTSTHTVATPLPAGPNTVETSPRTFFFAPSNSAMTARYLTSIMNFDANIGHKYTPWLSAYAGIRYIKLKEELDLSLHAPPFPDDDVNWKTKNSMVGLQIGARADILKVAGVPASSPWSLDANIALAMLHNDASAVFFEKPELNISASPSSSFCTPGVAAEADLGLRLTRNIKLAVGYQMLYLSRVALAPNQVGGTGNFVTVPLTSSVEKTSALYHGGVAKFVVTLP
jgi:hypothetical protein